MTPSIVEEIPTVAENQEDDFLILSSSWEERCYGLAERAKKYRSKMVLVNVYGDHNLKQEANLKKIHTLLQPCGEIKNVNSLQSNPIEGIKRVLYHIKNNFSGEYPRISFDISCFTRRHFLQLLNCLDCNDLLGNTKFYYSQPIDYFTNHHSTIAEGISSICDIETFSGENLSSRDTALIIFLNFEGRRAIALWQELQPHVTVPILPDPPFKAEWKERSQDQNKLLLSTLNLNWDSIEKVDPLDTNSTVELLKQLIKSNIVPHNILKHNKYNFFIAPLGTKPQVLGIFKFWRLFPNEITLVYPAPIYYKDIPDCSFPTEKTWFIDYSKDWNKI